MRLFFLSLFFCASHQILAADLPIKIATSSGSTAALLESYIPDFKQQAKATVEVVRYNADLAVLNLTKDIIELYVGPNLTGNFARLAKEGKISQQKDSDYQSTLVSEVTIWAAVHPEQDLKGLSHEQITGILSGKINTWESINGNKAPLRVLLASDKPSTNVFLEKTYLGGKSSSAEMTKDFEGQLRALQKDKFAVAFMTETVAGADGFKPKLINADIKFPIFLYMKKTNSREDVKAVFQWVKSLGRLELKKKINS